MKTEWCSSRRSHQPHRWRWRIVFRRWCLGLTVASCGRMGKHSPHWHGEHYEDWCPGLDWQS